MSDLFANYEPQRSAFESVLQPACSKRVLMFHGQSGYGKTSLLQCCRRRASEKQVFYIPIDFKGGFISVDEIFSRSGYHIGWERLPTFTQKVTDFINIQIGKNSLIGIGQSISVVLNVEYKISRDARRIDLTDAWFNDMKALGHLLLFIFDTYEKATTEVKEWICAQYLPRAVLVDNVRTVIAGQNVPDVTFDLGDCCTTYLLDGVHDPKHWFLVTQERKLHIPAANPIDWLTGVCHALQGCPETIMKLIDNLPVCG